MTDRVEYRFNAAADSFFGDHRVHTTEKERFSMGESALVRSPARVCQALQHFPLAYAHAFYWSRSRCNRNREKKMNVRCPLPRCQHISERTRTIYTALTIPFTDANMKNVCAAAAAAAATIDANNGWKIQAKSSKSTLCTVKILIYRIRFSCKGSYE